jgi:N-acetylglucosaminyldiphosphoundecaprenol N-acetyl-beta-D-mannosaminyltransferase
MPLSDTGASATGFRPERVDVLGTQISCITLESAVEIFDDWITRDAREYVCVTGMHGVMESRRDDELRLIHNRAGLTTPDGMPMVWAGRWAGAEIARVYGPDLMRTAFGAASERGWSTYFFGGSPDVLDDLRNLVSQEFPGLIVAGWSSPPFRDLSEQEEQDALREINESGADIVWVALGTPKQERWMARCRPALTAPILVGVGAAFDLVTGALPQAPRWMQHNGLEWLYRLAVEPRRLWRRYLLNIPRFVVGVVRRPPRLVPRGSDQQDPVAAR